MNLRKLAAAAVLAIGGTMLAATPAHAANIASNPGFEDGLAGWSCTASSGATAVSSPVHGGSKALQATPQGSDTGRCQQTVPVKPSSSYSLSGWVRGAYVFLGVSGTGITEQSTWTSSPSAYAQLTRTFTTGASTNSVTIYVNSWYGQGAYQADDIVLDGPPGAGAPAVPTNVTGTSTPSTATLKWAASEGATSYNVYRDGTKVGSATTTTYTDIGAPAGSHVYQVTAVNAVGESARSESVTLVVGNDTPQVPATPTGLTGTGGTTTATLKWTASSGATSYNVYRDGVKVGTATTTTYTETPSAGSYSYQVSAVNSVGESAKTAAVSVTVGNDTPPPPGTPTGVTATVSGTTVTLKWNGASGNPTGYNVYRGNSKVGTTTTTTFSEVLAGGTYAYQVSAVNPTGESAKSAPVTVTVGPGDPTSNRVLVGYLHASFANGSGYVRMADVPKEWDFINLSFGEPTSVTSGDIRFVRCPVAECPSVEPDADFIAAIKAKQAQGKKVLISIGGQNGQVQLTTTAARDKFVESVGAIIDKYGLDGLDVDFEGHSLYLNAGDTNLSAPTTPVIVNLISALKTLKAKYGSKFVLTMAPETFFVQLGYQFYGPGANGSADQRAGSYLPVIHAMRNDLTLLHVQDYNSGPITGLDNQYHTMGNADFHIAMTDMLLAGFPIAGNTNNVFPALRPEQVAIGLPAAQYAGNGYTSVAEVQKAFDCLAKGTNCGTYKPRGVYRGLRGLMTWSINWDKYNNFEFSRNHRAYLDALN
ncbi:carbohydrate binding domain-containing protein [Streptosporangium saharense]|uniref:chitinase n=1 Tax=Streptosporangium saharense TaxID=1706840 RepID=A0A7W7QJR2_9ACTN|nr:glycosyl hydrolase family 18 protein [Streptosporangium saharense]MBB4914753.1 chitinase [Streptosporangium saharense]